MESTVVIKVKYGDTLRRFHARVHENKQLDLDIVGLKAKILSLFNFSADENLILRYVDEDGDLVTLVNDDDLHDMMRQRLKFLRIDVHVSNDNGGISNARSSESSTPLTSFTPKPFLSKNVVIAPEALKSVPEVLREAVSKLAIDLVANLAPGGGPDVLSRASATPLTSLASPDPFLREQVSIYADVLKSVEQLQVAVSKLSPDLASVAKSGGKSNAGSRGNATPFTSSPTHDQDVAIYADALNSAEQLQEATSKLSFKLASLAASVGKSNAKSSGNAANPLGSSPAPKVGVGADALKSAPEALHEPKLSINLISHPLSSSADFISKTVQSTPISLDQTPNAAGPSSKNVPEESVMSEATGPILRVMGSTFHAGQQVDTGNVTKGVVAGVAPVDLNFLPGDPYSSQSTNVSSAPFSLAVPEGDGKKGKMCGGDNFPSKGEIGGTSLSSAVPNSSSAHTTSWSSGASVECPFAGTYTYDLRQPNAGKHCIYPFKRSHSHTEATNGMFHKGVRCDGCGVYPITGPRFKSKVKDNYDLCSICFSEIGNETDYVRMDRPMSVHGPKCLKLPLPLPQMGAPLPPPIIKASAFFKHALPKLDSQFILDVNVIDGTMMAPSTAFTKIWRMRNNGTVVWPKGIELVCIGGDKFSDSDSVYVEVPEDGVPVNKELDIAVDFRAPQLPGRYVSYWRLASPSGQKFGQRVWVLIQVDASLKDSFYESSQGLNLNIPLDVDGSNGSQSQILDINEPIEDNSSLQHLNPDAPTKPVIFEDKQPFLKLENEFPVNEAACVHPATSLPAAASAAPLEGTAGAVLTNQRSSAVDSPSSSLAIGGNNSIEETLLKELEDMGFKEVGLNKEILRMNEYNLEQSVDDLCGVSEWDPILEELREMGFRDKEMNRRLLKKNNGSIKRVVMDLINGE